MTTTGRRAPGGRHVLFIAITALLLAVLWVVWVVRFRPWVAHNDFAVMRLSLERALDGRIPTVGTYSRLGVYHPGPLREWVFALPYALGGGRAATLPATALVLNAGWLLACGWLAARCGVGGCRIALSGGATLLVVGLGLNLASPWNPHLAILPLYVACWAVTLLSREGLSREGLSQEGKLDLPLALVAVAAASFAGQMHASALPVAGSLLVFAVSFPIVRSWPRLHLRACVPLGVGLVLWIGVLVDLRRLGSSNLVDLAQTGAISTLGVGNALGLVSRLMWPPTGATGLSIRPSAASMVGFSRVWILVLVTGLVGTAVLAFRRETAWSRPDRDDSRDPDRAVELETIWRGGVVALATLTISVLTIAAFAPPPFRYLFGPLQAVAVFALAVLASWPIGMVLGRATQGVSNAASSAVLGVLAVVCVVMFVIVPVDDHESAARRELGVDAAVARFLEAHPSWRTIQVVGLDMVGASAQDEVIVIAYRAGREIRSDQFGLDLRAPDGREPVLAVAMGPSLQCLSAEPDAQVVLSGFIGEEPVGIFGLDADVADVSRCLGIQRIGR